MPGRSYSNGTQYRYGFNRQEKSREVTAGNYTALFWEYDSRTSIRWNRDPVVDPSLSPYATNEDNPIKNTDPDGNCSTCPPPKVNASLNLTIGSHSKGLKFNLSVTQSVGDFSLSAGVGVTKFSQFLNTGKKGVELRASALVGYDDGKTGGSLGTNFFRGLGGMKREFDQRTGILNFKSGDFSFSYENDGTPFPKLGLGDGNDSYRTAAARIGIGNFSTGFNLVTGPRKDYSDDARKVGKMQIRSFGERMPNGFVVEGEPQYRMGAAYVGYGETKIGINSDRYIRHPIQDMFAHNMNFNLLGLKVDTRQPGFKSLSNTITPYYQFNSSNLFKPVTTPTFTLND